MTCLGESQSGLYLVRYRMEVPFACKMLRENSDHSFNATENGAMDHDRSSMSRPEGLAICPVILSITVCRLILQVKTIRQLIVKLDCSALMLSF